MINLKIAGLFILIALLTRERLFAQQKTRLINNWEFLKQGLGGVMEAVRPVIKGNPESVPALDITRGSLLHRRGKIFSKEWSFYRISWPANTNGHCPRCNALV